MLKFELLAVAIGLTGWAAAAQAQVISPTVRIDHYSGNAIYAAYPQTGGCPDGTLQYSVYSWDGGFYIAFEPRPDLFTLDSNRESSHGICRADVIITMPAYTCYTLDKVLITGEAHIYEGERLALVPVPQTFTFNAASNRWVFEGSFHTPIADNLDTAGPWNGSFWQETQPVNLSKNNELLSKCETQSKITLDLQALFLNAQPGAPLSTAHINQYIYSFTTRNQFTAIPRIPPDRFVH